MNVKASRSVCFEEMGGYVCGGFWEWVREIFFIFLGKKVKKQCGGRPCAHIPPESLEWTSRPNQKTTCAHSTRRFSSLDLLVSSPFDKCSCVLQTQFPFFQMFIYVP